ncbi:hypothetical protein Rumal_3464 (plasmid) [Ruminococcus albus 7 = DSM 20455]|uniref:Uncharacterized protein n=1 Tax=Ruminococcus albus (strain ATCC 27210 / DSM 20455 / JCM 14654 / NCDO 2250 / 7) TaxID=697329 RepID=E6UJR5_RUMA7|nr:hypothetical protein Rumal_3464 [Ruminococcus albus 7 = DSM 20455]
MNNNILIDKIENAIAKYPLDFVPYQDMFSLAREIEK